MALDNTQMKYVLITGASTGIGRATAEYLAKNGFKVYACARKQSDLENLAKISNITPIKMDVTNQVDIDAALRFVKEQNTGLFAIVNNAGIAKAGPLMDLPVEDLKIQFDVNVLGIHRVTKAFFPLILKSKGRIVMMSSDSGFFSTPFFGPYCSSKFAVEGYSDALRRELLLYDVKVIIIQPGRVTTPIWDKGEGLLEKFENSMFIKEAKEIGEYAVRKGKTAGLNPIEIGKLIYNVLIDPKPKLRYLIAPSTFKYKMIKILPASRVDKMIEKELRELKEK